MKAGFGWEIGAFETWDTIGVAKTVEAMKTAGYNVSTWVEEMLASGATSFYKVADGKRMYFDIPTKSYKVIPGGEAFLILQNHRDKIIWQNVKFLAGGMLFKPSLIKIYKVGIAELKL